MIGMVAQFVEAPELVKKFTTLPDDWIQQCKLRGINLEYPTSKVDLGLLHGEMEESFESEMSVVVQSS